MGEPRHSTLSSAIQPLLASFTARPERSLIVRMTAIAACALARRQHMTKSSASLTMYAPSRRSCPNTFHPNTKRRMYRFDRSGEMDAPCPMPRLASFARGVHLHPPRPRDSSTGATRHCLTSARTRPSLTRRATERIHCACGIVSKSPLTSVSTTSPCPRLTRACTPRTASCAPCPARYAGCSDHRSASKTGSHTRTARRVHPSVTERRDSQGPLPSVRLLPPHPAHRGASIALVPERLHPLLEPRFATPPTQSPRTSRRPPRALRRSLGTAPKPRPQCPPSAPCRRAHGTETRALPSLSHAAPCAASRPSAAFVVSPTIPASLAPARARPRPRSLRSTAMTRLPRSYGPLRHPARPRPDPRDLRFAGHAPPASQRGFPCCVALPYGLYAIATPPAGALGARVARLPQHRRPCPYLRRVGSCVALFEACSAFTARDGR